MSKKYLGILLLFAAALCWGPSPVVSKLALNEVPQLSFAFLGRILALAIVFILFFKKGYFRIDKKDLMLFVLAGLTGAVLNVAFFVYGIKLTRATDAQAIFTLAPAINAVFAYFILKEKIKVIQIFGVIIGLIGALLIAGADFFVTGSLRLGSMEGNFLIFMACISWVFYIIISKKLSKKYSPISITSYSFLVSAIVFLPFAFFENLKDSSWIGNLGFAGIFGIIYQGIFASVIAFLTYQTGLKLTNAFMAGVILYLNPVVTTIFAVPVLGEKITSPFIAGTVLIICGSLIATQYELVKGHIHRHIKRIRGIKTS